MTIMPHLKSVDKGAFLLVHVREGVTSPMRDNYMVKFYSQITKIQELPGAASPGSPPGRCPMPLKKNSTPANQKSWIRPCCFIHLE